MNSPTPVAVAQQNIAIDLLFPSPTNPRKRFDPVKLNELADSIKMQGVFQPILVRTAKAPQKAQWPFPTPDSNKPNSTIKFEIIAGERRYRASKLAGLSEVPCFIRELTDLQVLHAQVIENLQRDDLHPIEEAEGYEKLMQQVDEKGNKFSADTIAEEVGKSRAYVYAKLKLLDLCPDVRDQFFNGQLDSSTALLIARIPTQKLQMEAAKKITEGDGMSYRAAKEYVQREFMLDLSAAPFDIKDAKLVEKAGACSTCNKCTGNQPELFDDVKSKDVCTDTACFATKKATHIAATLKAAEANGNEVIRKEAAKEMLGNKFNASYRIQNAGLVKLTDDFDGDDTNRTWADVLNEFKLLKPVKGKSALNITLIENPFEDGLIEAVNEEVAMKALEDAGFTAEEPQRSEQDIAREKERAARFKEQQKENDRIEAELAQINVYRKRLFDTLREQIAADMCKPTPHVADGLYRILAEVAFDTMVDDHRDAEELVKLYMPNAQLDDDEDANEAFVKFIPSLTTQQHFSLILDCAMVRELLVNKRNREDGAVRMLAIAKEIGIDADAIEQEVISELTKPTKTRSKKGATA